MFAEALPRELLLEILQQQILPRVKNAVAPLVLAQPPFTSPSVRITPSIAPLLPVLRKVRHITLASHWEKEGFNSGHYPILMWVVEGEADYRIGVTRRMAAQNPELCKEYGYYVAALPTNSFLIVPPEVPISDGSRAHWERPRVEEAHSRLLWFHILPAGMSFHMCSTRGTDHTSTRSLFFSEPRLLPLAEFLLEELQNRGSGSEELAHHYLLALLLHCRRALLSPQIVLGEDRSALALQHDAGRGSAPLQRACSYIEANLSQKISLEHIAAHAYVSRSYLNRLFRSEMNVSTANYLTQRRLERACSLLKTTDLPVKRIGVLCGYSQPEHFSRVFVQHYGISPGVFRRND